MSKKKQAATSKFSDQYKDPRWQKKRLQILERDRFTCRLCRDKESTLHVHHTRYEKGRAVWEAKDSVLVTLCTDCHSYAHTARDATGLALNQLEAGLLMFGGKESVSDLFQILDILLSFGINDAAMNLKVIRSMVESSLCMFESGTCFEAIGEE